MSDYFNAFEMSPVPAPGPDAVAPEPFRGIYGMPMFVTVPTTDLTASTTFWVDVLGFIELFSIPGQVVHLRRWAFQDVLLVPADGPAPRTSGMTVSFACVLDQLDPLAAECTAAAVRVTGPQDTPWNTRDLEVSTPEGVRVVFTAARPFDPESAEAQGLMSEGILAPESLVDAEDGDDDGSPDR